jgi:hypothetical protein
MKPAPVSNNKWEGMTFAQDQDGRMTAKFKRLMGIKEVVLLLVAQPLILRATRS